MKNNKHPQPGDVVTCVIGNLYETAWCPKAKVLLLATEESHHSTRFFGLAKKPNGDMEILFHVAERPAGFIADDRGWGDYYCAFSLTHAEMAETTLARFLPLIQQSMTYHVDKINALPAYTVIAGSPQS